MQQIGFNITKISAENNFEKNSKVGQTSTDVQFLDVSKDKVPLINNLEILKISFSFLISYKELKEDKDSLGFVKIEGHSLFTTDQKEIKDALISWKKKEIPENIRLPLFNLILKKCSLKALMLEDELGLPSHFPLPQVRQEQQKKN